VCVCMCVCVCVHCCLSYYFPHISTHQTSKSGEPGHIKALDIIVATHQIGVTGTDIQSLSGMYTLFMYVCMLTKAYSYELTNVLLQIIY